MGDVFTDSGITHMIKPNLGVTGVFCQTFYDSRHNRGDHSERWADISLLLVPP